MKNKKIHMSNKSKTLLKVFAGISLVSLSFGIVFGISAATFKISYVDLFNKANRQIASKGSLNYSNQNAPSRWNIANDENDNPIDFVDKPENQLATEESRNKRHQPFFNKNKNGEDFGVDYYSYSQESSRPKWSELDPTKNDDKALIEKIMK